MKILALDPATRCGWAHSDGPSGTWDLRPRRDESGGMRFLRFLGKLNETLAQLGIQIVAFEAARHAAPKMQGALVVQAELQGVLKAWCEERGIPYRGYSPSEVKSIATGRGNANKPLVLAAAQRKWGMVVEDSDQADALWILELTKRDLGC